MSAPGFFLRLSFAILVGLSLWVGVVAGVIEVQNARAGYYLPRRDLEDGKWRVSRADTPRDKLRGLVGGVGLLQYLISPFVVLLGIYHATHTAVRSRWILSITALLVAVVAGGLAFYRDYLGSLGW